MLMKAHLEGTTQKKATEAVRSHDEGLLLL